MPSTRRKSSNPAASAQQTLAFGPNSNRVTKPSLPTSSKRASKPVASSPISAAAIKEISPPSPAPEQISEPPTATPPQPLAIRNQQVSSTKPGKSNAEEQAGKVTDAQIKRYWQGKEDERIAPRVHQAGLSVAEKVLREFDLSSQYGPCIGIPRMKRWKRAQGLGLKPPVEVMAVLLKEEEKGDGKAERAFIEGLLTSRIAAHE